MNLEENYTEIEVINNDTLFFDSYAFFEILYGNSNYEKYKNKNIITTKLNLFELYFCLLTEEGEEYAFLIPPEIGYGDIVFSPGIRSLIPPNSILYFRIRLMLIENENDILTQEQNLINQFIINGELNDTSKVPVEFIERFANWGAPLALLLLRGWPRSGREWFK